VKIRSIQEDSITAVHIFKVSQRLWR